jgi:hypothetical protein
MGHGINNLLERLFKPCLRNMPKAKEDGNNWKAHLVFWEHMQLIRQGELLLGLLEEV